MVHRHRKALVMAFGTALAVVLPMSPASATTTPDLTVSATHGHDSFLRVDAPNTTVYGERLTLTVANRGRRATDGSAVTVTDTLPAGLAALVNNPGFGAGPVAASGAGWTCTGSATSTCTRSDVLKPGKAYPPITITVRVTNTAAAAAAQLRLGRGWGKRGPELHSRHDSGGHRRVPERLGRAGRGHLLAPFQGIRSGVDNPEGADGCTLQDAIWEGEPFATTARSSPASTPSPTSSSRPGC